MPVQFSSVQLTSVHFVAVYTPIEIASALIVLDGLLCYFRRCLSMDTNRH